MENSVCGLKRLYKITRKLNKAVYELYDYIYNFSCYMVSPVICCCYTSSDHCLFVDEISTWSIDARNLRMLDKRSSMCGGGGLQLTSQEIPCGLFLIVPYKPTYNLNWTCQLWVYIPLEAISGCMDISHVLTRGLAKASFTAVSTQRARKVKHFWSNSEAWCLGISYLFPYMAWMSASVRSKYIGMKENY